MNEVERIQVKWKNKGTHDLGFPSDKDLLELIEEFLNSITSNMS